MVGDFQVAIPDIRPPETVFPGKKVSKEFS
jgi:hypothetical protein